MQLVYVTWPIQTFVKGGLQIVCQKVSTGVCLHIYVSPYHSAISVLFFQNPYHSAISVFFFKIPSIPTSLPLV